MTILKSILLTTFLYIVASLFALLILSFDNNLSIYQHIVGLSVIIPYLITYSILIAYLRLQKVSVAFDTTSKTNTYGTLIPILLILAIGNHLFDLPFFQWKNLSNTYLGTTWEIPVYSNSHISTVKLYYVAYALIIAPIFEEIFFRYYIFGGLLKKYSVTTALITSSVLFSLIHIDSLESLRNLVPTFIFGIISALVYLRTKKICNSIILHFIANGLWFLTVVFAKQYSTLMQEIGFGIKFWIIFSIGVILLLLGVRKITNANTRLSAMPADE